jgi:dihydroorotase-like cyclic amidohydrolase
MAKRSPMQRPISRRSLLIAGSSTAGVAATAIRRGAEPTPFVAAAGAARVTGADAATIALTHVTVIDATGAPARPDMTVLVSGPTITAIGASAETEVPPTARVVNLTGKFLIPGLCDMHAHSLYPEGILPELYIATGVTTVREMMGTPWVYDWRDRIESGQLDGPRWVIGSQILDGSPSIWTGNDAGLFTEIANERQAREAVRQAKRDGADFIKVYSRLSKQNLYAIAEEARRQRIPFAGHHADAVPMIDAAVAGQRSFEHFFPAMHGTSSAEAGVRRLVAAIKITGSGNGHQEWFQGIHPADWLAANTYDPRRAVKVYRELKATQTTVTPTLYMHRVTDLPETVAPDHERLKYLPAGTLDQWTSQLEEFKKGRTPEQAARYRSLFRHRLRVLDQMRRAGVPIMAGTDAAGIAFGYPGFALHDELALFVKAGFTPMEALQAATREPARFLGLDNVLGTVSQGKVADLVVLDADPLRDIRNTLKIHAVMTRGRYLDPGQRRRLLAEIQAAAGAATTVATTPNCCP